KIDFLYEKPNFFMKIAANQPYFFPYIGYFQLIEAVDRFVFYDILTYIKNGWINRNRILINGESEYLTVPLIKASQNKLIKEIDFNPDNTAYQNLLKTIRNTYANAPYFNQAFPVIEN